MTAGPGWVRSDLEDDFHHMHVTLRHAGGVVTAVEPVMERWPWTTCPLAGEELQRTFTGARLEDVPKLGDKTQHCTHLYDLALLAAAHAGDGAPVQYDVLVSDPVEGRQRAELRRNGVAEFSWVLERRGRFVEPPELAGGSLYDLKAWLENLPPDLQEAGRVLRWGAMVAHGRILPLSEQSDATVMQPRCFTFQPRNAVKATRIGEIKDFSAGAHAPLERRRAAISGGVRE